MINKQALRTETRTKTMSITSGKGGVGKSTLTANLAYKVGQQGQRVLILDGDLSMANIDIMYRMNPKHTLEHVIRGEKELKDVICTVAPNVDLIPGGSGIYGLADLSVQDRAQLLEQIDQLDQHYDIMLIDTAPGIDENVLYLNSAVQEICLVVTPDPASITDSYALIKVLNQQKRESRFSILCNQVKDEAEAKRIFQRLCDVSSHFLCVRLDYRGYIPMDVNVRNATKSQQLLVNSYPRSQSSFAIQELSKNLSSFKELPEIKGGIQFFWSQLVGMA